MLIQLENSLETWKNKILIHAIEMESSELSYTKFTEFLSADELEKLNAFKFYKDRLRYSITHHYLRVFLSKIVRSLPADVELVTNPYGKKKLKNQVLSHIHFNLSHSANIIVYAFNQQNQLGVDVEYLDYNINYLELSEKYFSKNERAFIVEAKNLNEQVYRFYKLWTRKEAYLKAKGTGLGESLQTLDVLDDEPRFTEENYCSSSSKDVCHLKTLHYKDHYVISVACIGQLKDTEESFEKL